MAKYKCKMCGAPLDVSEGQTVAICDFCQSKQTVADANDERKENLFNRANALRVACDFDKAILSYQSILSIFPSEPEAYWGLCLCKYGIEYVDDPATQKKIPTIHRMSFDSILKDSDYIAALSYADAIACEEYQEEASQIADIQKNILSISQKEEPFDIFICYKETTENGKRTPDSVLAQEVYTNLTGRGYKVFFSRITLESKLGSMYEPYIFAALNSAKIMLVLGTKKEYFEAVWVKNEWSRFIDMMKTRPDRYLIPCYRNMDAYEMPEQFLSFQGQDMGKLGFMQDLIRGIDKIMNRNEEQKAKTETKIIQTDVNISALLTRAEILIGDQEYQKADELLERVLDNDPKNSQAYLLKLLIEHRFKTIDDLKTLNDTIEENSNFRKAYDFGDDKQKNRLNSILYDIAMNCKIQRRYLVAKALFSKITGFKDADKQALECLNSVNEDFYNKAIALKEAKRYNEAIAKFEIIKDYKDSEDQISKCQELVNEDFYNKAIALKEVKKYYEAIEKFEIIKDYKDSEDQISICQELAKEYTYNKAIALKEEKKYDEAIARFEIIKDYKDSEDQKSECQELLKKEEKDKYLRRRRIKKKIILSISSTCALLITIVLLVIFLYFKPNGYFVHTEEGVTEITEDMLKGVKRIRPNTFEGCKSLQTVTIPSSVTSIGERAFYACSNLSKVTIQKGVTSIGERAFYGCTSLESITIPSSVKSIDLSAFYGCTNLSEVNITSLASWCQIDFASDYANPLYENEQVILKINREEITNLTTITENMLEGATSIPDFTFKNCTSLESITIPSSVISIGQEAFHGCTSLRNIVIPSSVTSIGKYAFYWCAYDCKIYCEVKSMPYGWESYWCSDGYVYWKDEWHYENGVPIPNI